MSDPHVVQPDVKIVLVTPEIPGNTGTIGRTCVALGLELILIHPLGFDLSDKSVRRAGLDYWKHVSLSEYASWKDFIAQRAPQESDLFFFEEFGEGGTLFDAPYTPTSYLIFGRETKGLPPGLVAEHAQRTYRLPMRSPHIRSLNLANAATAVAYQAMRNFLT